MKRGTRLPPSSLVNGRAEEEHGRHRALMLIARTTPPTRRLRVGGCRRRRVEARAMSGRSRAGEASEASRFRIAHQHVWRRRAGHREPGRRYSLFDVCTVVHGMKQQTPEAAFLAGGASERKMPPQVPGRREHAEAAVSQSQTPASVEMARGSERQGSRKTDASCSPRLAQLMKTPRRTSFYKPAPDVRARGAAYTSCASTRQRRSLCARSAAVMCVVARRDPSSSR